MSDELHNAYQREARLANAIGLSVPVSLAVQQLDELRKISASLLKLAEQINNLHKVLEKPPLIEVSSTAPFESTPTLRKKAP
jgi:hypothetical protein